METTRPLGRSCALLFDRSIVMENEIDDLSYQWHGSSYVILVDCRVVSGLPE
jgi:hypothetical protein